LNVHCVLFGLEIDKEAGCHEYKELAKNGYQKWRSDLLYVAISH
jgi:hypothetical protein